MRGSDQQGRWLTWGVALVIAALAGAALFSAAMPSGDGRREQSRPPETGSACPHLRRALRALAARDLAEVASAVNRAKQAAVAALSTDGLAAGPAENAALRIWSRAQPRIEIAEIRAASAQLRNAVASCARAA